MKVSPLTLPSLGAVLILILIAITNFRFFGNSAASKIVIASHTEENNPNLASDKVKKIAQQVTVRIITKAGAGSGVMIKRDGNKYTVLTCKHVVGDNQEKQYQVLSPDGVLYPAQLQQTEGLGNLDLALVEFESRQDYQIAKFGDTKSLFTGAELYATGFPNYQYLKTDTMEDTRNWGRKAFRFTTGKFSWYLERSLPQGYQLGYTNEVEVGMSGGPVFNQQGEVVGINGRLKYPVQGIDVYTFADGTKPTTEMFQKMESLSWAIPIKTFQELKQK